MDDNVSAKHRLKAYCKEHGELLGLKELADVLGISRANLVNKMARGKAPIPDYKLAATSCWHAKTVIKWIDKQ